MWVTDGLLMKTANASGLSAGNPAASATAEPGEAAGYRRERTHGFLFLYLFLFGGEDPGLIYGTCCLSFPPYIQDLAGGHFKWYDVDLPLNVVSTTFVSMFQRA